MRMQNKLYNYRYRMYIIHNGVMLFTLTLLCRLALRNQHIRMLVFRTFRLLLAALSSAYTRLTPLR